MASSTFPRYFSYRELTRTSLKADNTPEWHHLKNLVRLGLFLDQVRGRFGHAIRVNSAYRSQAVNTAVCGTSNSAHLEGLAADICAFTGREADNRKLLAILELLLPEIDQLIVYHKVPCDSSSEIRFFHVGLCASAPRKQKLIR